MFQKMHKRGTLLCQNADCVFIRKEYFKVVLRVFHFFLNLIVYSDEIRSLFVAVSKNGR